MLKNCPGCGREFDDEGFKKLCYDCFRAQDDRPLCKRCGKRIPHSYATKGWQYCDKCAKALGLSLF